MGPIKCLALCAGKVLPEHNMSQIRMPYHQVYSSVYRTFGQRSRRKLRRAAKRLIWMQMSVSRTSMASAFVFPGTVFSTEEVCSNYPDRYFAKRGSGTENGERFETPYGEMYNKYPIKEADHSSHAQKIFTKYTIPHGCSGKARHRKHKICFARSSHIGRRCP